MGFHLEGQNPEIRGAQAPQQLCREPEKVQTQREVSPRAARQREAPGRRGSGSSSTELGSAATSKSQTREACPRPWPWPGPQGAAILSLPDSALRSAPCGELLSEMKGFCHRWS